jgi:type IV secretion system protein VirB6
MFRLFTPLFTEMDHVTMRVAGDVSSRLIVAIAPVVSAGLMLYFTVWGLLVIRGAVQQPVLEFLGKVIRTAVIVSVALSAGVYQQRVAEVVSTLPDDLATAVMGNDPQVWSGGVVGPAGSETGQGAVIDRAAGEGLDKAGEAFKKGTIYTQQGMAFYTFGVLILLATVLMVGVGGAMILVAKVSLALLAALGPLFIAALLFECTRRFFDRWVAMVATNVLIVVVFACVFTFMLGIYGNYMTGFKFDGNVAVVYGIGGALLLTIVSCAMLGAGWYLAVGLGGGFAHYARPFAGIHPSKWPPRRPSSPSRKQTENA